MDRKERHVIPMVKDVLELCVYDTPWWLNLWFFFELRIYILLERLLGFSVHETGRQ